LDAAATEALDARQVIERFGGIRPMASKLGLTASTVQGWSERNSIPAARRDAVLKAAREQGLGIVPRDLGSAPCAPASPPDPRAKAQRALRPGMTAADWQSDDDHGAKTTQEPAPTAGDDGADRDHWAGRDGTAMNQEDKGSDNKGPEKGAEKGAGPETAKKAAEAPSKEAAKDTSKEAGKEAAKAAGGIGLPASGAKEAPKGQAADKDKAAAGTGKAPEKTPDKMGEKGKPAAAAVTKPSPGKPAKTRQPKPGRAAFYGGLTVGVLLLVAGFAAALFTRDYWQPLLGEAAPAQDNALLERFQSLDERIASLEGAPAPTVDLSPLEGRLAELESQASGATSALQAEIESLRREMTAELETIGALGSGGSAESEAARAALAEELAELRSQLAGLPALESQLSELSSAQAATSEALAASQASGTSGDAALILAILQLRSALSGSGPFAEELRLLSDLAGRQGAGEIDALIAPLTPHTASGLPSLADLRTSFPDVARRIVAEGAGGAEEDMWSGVKRSLSRIVTIRPLEPDPADKSAGSLVAQAEAALDGGDLAGALAAVGQLEGRAADAAADWQAQAALRQDAQGILTSLGDLVIARIGS
jgi:hypothetical protein